MSESDNNKIHTAYIDVSINRSDIQGEIKEYPIYCKNCKESEGIISVLKQKILVDEYGDDIVEGNESDRDYSLTCFNCNKIYAVNDVMGYMGYNANV